MLDFSNIFIGILKNIWWFIPILIIIYILKSPYFKGIIGEKIVKFFLNSFTNDDEYILLENITLEDRNDTTQIDFILISVYGIFVIEVKNYKGWITGKEHDKYWKQTIYKKKNLFQNPLHQNYKHIKFLENILDEKCEFINLVVFSGVQEFKSEMPVNVINVSSLKDFISSYTKELYSIDDIIDYANQIEYNSLEKGINTNRKHIKNITKNTR